MKISRSIQRGSADLVSVAVGLTVLAIVMAGTASSMVYGRSALIKEEHYKAAAYLLRGKMEEEQASLQLIDEARLSRNLQPMDWGLHYIEMSNDRSGIRPIQVHITQDAIDWTDLPETGRNIDYYTITMHATWRERDDASDNRTEPGQVREITLTSSVVTRSTIG